MIDAEDDGKCLDQPDLPRGGLPAVIELDETSGEVSLTTSVNELLIQLPSEAEPSSSMTAPLIDDLLNL